MNLPDLPLQLLYGRLGWALVLAALLLALLPTLLATRRGRQAFADLAAPGWRTTLTVVAAMLVLMALPGEASPGFWLVLAFQQPSGVLVGFSVVSLCARWRAQPVRFMLPPGLALILAVTGLVMYLDIFGVLALGLYYGGFHPVAAPLLTCGVAAGCALHAWRGEAVGPAAAVLIAVLLFSLLRLPTGNLWDALLDPLLWSWALGSVIVVIRRQLAVRKAGHLHLEGANGSNDELVQVQAQVGTVARAGD